jgi:stress-induced morphogen
MYNITVVSSRFAGVGLVAQHRLVHDVLRAELGAMHGLTLRTLTPDKFKPASAPDR